jgi:hypothetical protein
MTDHKENYESKMMYYYRVDENLDDNFCANLEARNKIAEALAFFNFQWIDMTNGQASFEPVGDFENFKAIVRLVERVEGFNVIELKKCKDVGIGLFTDNFGINN